MKKNPAIFCSTFRSMNNLINQKNNLWKADEIVFKFKIIQGKTASNARPAKIYKNLEIPDSTGKVARSAPEYFLV